MKEAFQARPWSTIYSVMTAVMLSYVAGIAFGFSSPTLLELSLLDEEEKRFDSTISDIFGVTFTN